MNTVLEQFGKIGIIPVIVIDDAADAVPLGNALVNGGLPAAEVTFRTAAAKEAIASMAENCPDLLVGAGTILSVDMCKEAVAAGAKFIVTPGFDEEITRYCIENNIPVTPGCATPADVQACYRLGLRTVKFFPAESYGGIKTIKAISAPYHMMKFMPTGGISEKNLEDYLKEKMILCVGGSWMVKKDLISAKKFDEIEDLCKKAAAKRDEVRGK